MGRLSSMGGFRFPDGAAAKKKAIQATIDGINADLKDGIISEAVAFEALCSELSVITGLPVEAKRSKIDH